MRRISATLVALVLPLLVTALAQRGADDLDVVQVSDREAFTMARRLVREEGMFCGGSSGLAMAGALKWLRANGAYLTEEDVVVVLLPDSGSRYLSKLFNDE